jgi:hypothetical protein
MWANLAKKDEHFLKLQRKKPCSHRIFRFSAPHRKRRCVNPVQSRIASAGARFYSSSRLSSASVTGMA